jgi:hypothetical protein
MQRKDCLLNHFYSKIQCRRLWFAKSVPLSRADRPNTPVNPKGVIRDSGLPHAVLRRAGVISPDGASNVNSDYLLLMRSMPRDNHMHTVDARDAGLAFANAVDRGDAINRIVLLIGGNDTHVRLHCDVQDDAMVAVGSVGWVRRSICRGTLMTIAVGASPAGSTPRNLRPCWTFSSTTGRTRWRGWANPKSCNATC